MWLSTEDIIVKKRHELGLTQEELAQKVGISRGMLAMVERGTKQVNLRLAKKLAEVFECTVDDLC